MPNEKTIRVRFAPSPTGYLHVGGARTALFNWLFARATRGTFVLRIEDTDRERSSDEMTQIILDALQWLGLDWDEGPFHQAEGAARHSADARRLLEAGHAYRCFCTVERIEAKRAEAAARGTVFRYDRHCLLMPREEAEQRAAAGEPHTIRFRVPAGETAWDDIVHGPIAFDNAEIDDFIILRTDGSAIYNMAVVSDDVEMRITHVLRGDDHISNTPKQIMLYKALGAPLPLFGHVPLILGPDGKRLSKRHGATAVGEYQRAGILPDAMVNFLALLGWSPGTDEEVFTREELIQRFTLEGINKKSAIFDVQKLWWLNGQHLNRTSAEALLTRVQPLLIERGLLTEADAASRRDWLLRLMDLMKARARSIEDIAVRSEPYLRETIEYEPAAVAKHWKDPQSTAARLALLQERLAPLGDWQESSLETALRSLAEETGTPAGQFIHPLRVSLTGQAVGPGIFEIAALLGRDRTLQRITHALDTLRRDGSS